jgi:hypothetical protein
MAWCCDSGAIVGEKFAWVPSLRDGTRTDVAPRGCDAVRGTGFEPADPYGTAPSTLRRWPGLAVY